MKKNLGINDVSKILNCSTQHVRNLEKEGKLPEADKSTGSRKWRLSDVLLYKSSVNSRETMIITAPADEDSEVHLRELCLDFCVANKMKGPYFLNDDLREVESDPLIFSRHVTARLAGTRPSAVVIGGATILPTYARSILVELCLLHSIDIHFLNINESKSNQEL